MHYDKLVCSVIMLGFLFLTSCASTNQVTELSTEIKEINDKVSQINDRVDTLKIEVNQNKNEAMRANKRLDNQVSLYHK